jgi:hypothetical protein
MYDTHATAIQEHVRTGGAGAFRDVATFVLATIRVPLWSAAACTRAIVTSGEDAEYALKRCIWGHKRAGLAWIDANLEKWFEDAAFAHAMGSDEELLVVLAQCPGLGLAKAGFLAQLAFGRVGCIDSHNLRRFGLSQNLCSFDAKAQVATQLRRARNYIAACEQAGGCEALWDGWCNYVAENQQKRYDDGEHVSALHVYALGIE